MMLTQSRQAAKTADSNATFSPWDFKGGALGYM
jgi:hypothetical protein